MKIRTPLIVITLIGVAALSSASSTKIKPSLYERLGGIHKIAAFVDLASDWEDKDEMLLMNPTFKSVSDPKMAPIAKFFITGYLASKTGGMQMYSGPDVPSMDAGLMLSKEERSRSWMLRMKAMEQVGIDESTRKEFMKWYDSLLKKAKPMPIPMMELGLDGKSLYSRLGGIAPISMVVNDFINMLAADPTIGANPHVVKSLTSGKVSAAGLKYLVTEQVAQAAGGPWKYSGKTMADSHKGLMITENEWTAGGTIFKKVLDMYKVPAKEQGELLAAIAATKGDIVGK